VGTQGQDREGGLTLRTANDLKGKYVHYPSSVITKAPHIGLVEDVEEINGRTPALTIRDSDGHKILMSFHSIENVVIPIDEWLNNGGEG
jgi:hypothetical protein